MMIFLDDAVLTLPQGQDGPATPPPAGSTVQTEGPATPPVEGGDEARGKGSFTDTLLMFALIGGIVWLLIFAPERKARKKRQEMLDGVKKGDKVVTTGGLHGQVAEVREREIVIKAGDVRLTFTRSSVHEVVREKDGDES